MPFTQPAKTPALYRVWIRQANRTWVCFTHAQAVPSEAANKIAIGLLLGAAWEVAILHDGSTIGEGYEITRQ